MSVVVIAEKNSVAQAIKKAFPCYQVTCVAGHIMGLRYEFPNKPWLKTPLIQLLKDKLIYEPKPNLTNLKKIKSLKPTKVILACDPDEQGDLIEVHIVKYLDLKDCEYYTVDLESLSKEGIKKAFNNPKPLNFTQGLSAELRARLDLWFGSILSRLASLDAFKSTKRWVTYNTGRVQTPTLNFVFERSKLIKSFKPTNYWLTEIKHPGLIIFHKTLKEINQKKMDLSLVSIEPYQVKPKEGLNTDLLLNLLAREHAVFKKLGSPVISLMSSMYLNGFITYPRTDNGSFNNYPDLLTGTSNLWASEFKKNPIIPNLEPGPATDHGPICPLVNSSEVSGQLEKKVLKTIYNYLKKVYSGPNYYEKYTYKGVLEGKEIKLSILKGFKNFEDGLNSVETLPDLNTLTVTLESHKKQTNPPKLYTPATLLTEMKKSNVGTKSTRAGIIEDLIKNQFLKYQNDGLVCTPKGIFLCQYWNQKWSQILSPQLTSNIEKEFPIDREEKLILLENLYKKKLSNLI